MEICRICGPKAWTVVFKQSKAATKGLRVMDSVDPWVLGSNYGHVIVPLQLPVTAKQHENIVINSNITW